jgi:hypothetical protein
MRSGGKSYRGRRLRPGYVMQDVDGLLREIAEAVAAL